MFRRLIQKKQDPAKRAASIREQLANELNTVSWSPIKFTRPASELSSDKYLTDLQPLRSKAAERHKEYWNKHINDLLSSDPQNIKEGLERLAQLQVAHINRDLSNWEDSESGIKIKSDFVYGFNRWLRGKHKKDSEAYKRTPWGKAKLTYLPDVRKYVTFPIEQRIATYQQLYKLAMKPPRNLMEAYLFYKYFVDGQVKDIFENLENYGTWETEIQQAIAISATYDKWQNNISEREIKKEKDKVKKEILELDEDFDNAYNKPHPEPDPDGVNTNFDIKREPEPFSTNSFAVGSDSDDDPGLDLDSDTDSDFEDALPMSNVGDFESYSNSDSDDMFEKPKKEQEVAKDTSTSKTPRVGELAKQQAEFESGFTTITEQNQKPPPPPPKPIPVVTTQTTVVTKKPQSLHTDVSDLEPVQNIEKKIVREEAKLAAAVAKIGGNPIIDTSLTVEKIPTDVSTELVKYKKKITELQTTLQENENQKKKLLDKLETETKTKITKLTQEIENLQDQNTVLEGKAKINEKDNNKIIKHKTQIKELKKEILDIKNTEANNLANNQKQNKTLTETLQQTKNELKEKEMEVKKYKEKFKEKKAALIEARNYSTKLDSEVLTEQLKQSNLETRLKAYEKDNENLLTDYNNLKHETLIKESELNIAQKQQKKLQKKLQQIEDFNKENIARISELQKVQIKYNENLENITQLETQVDNYRKTVINKDVIINQQTKMYKKIIKENAKTNEAELADAKDKQQITELENKRLKKEKENVKKMEKKYKDKVETANKQLSTLKTQLENAKTSKEIMQSNIDTLSKQVDASEEEKNQLTTQVIEMGGRHNSLSTELVIAKKKEQALTITTNLFKKQVSLLADSLKNKQELASLPTQERLQLEDTVRQLQERLDINNQIITGQQETQKFIIQQGEANMRKLAGYIKNYLAKLAKQRRAIEFPSYLNRIGNKIKDKLVGMLKWKKPYTEDDFGYPQIEYNPDALMVPSHHVGEYQQESSQAPMPISVEDYEIQSTSVLPLPIITDFDSVVDSYKKTNIPKTDPPGTQYYKHDANTWMLSQIANVPDDDSYSEEQRNAAQSLITRNRDNISEAIVEQEDETEIEITAEEMRVFGQTIKIPAKVVKKFLSRSNQAEIMDDDRRLDLANVPYVSVFAVEFGNNCLKQMEAEIKGNKKIENCYVPAAKFIKYVKAMQISKNKDSPAVLQERKLLVAYISNNLETVYNDVMDLLPYQLTRNEMDIVRNERRLTDKLDRLCTVLDPTREMHPYILLKIYMQKYQLFK